VDAIASRHADGVRAATFAGSGSMAAYSARPALLAKAPSHCCRVFAVAGRGCGAQWLRLGGPSRARKTLTSLTARVERETRVSRGPHIEPCASPTVRSRGAHTRRLQRPAAVLRQTLLSCFSVVAHRAGARVRGSLCCIACIQHARSPDTRGFSLSQTQRRASDAPVAQKVEPGTWHMAHD
jgi:hypothetical protein